MQSNWKIKSNENIASADLLIKNKKYASSVHCSYYSIIQLMHHALLNDCKLSEKEIEKERKKGSKEHKGTHNWISNYIRDKILNKDFKATTSFFKSFKEIKSVRVKSDYKNCVILQREAKNSYENSQRIINILKENFTI